MPERTLWWFVKRKKNQLKRKWRLYKRKWKASSTERKMMTLSGGLLGLLLVIVLVVFLFSSPVPETQEAREEVLDGITDCIQDGSVEVLKNLISSRLATTSFKAGMSQQTKNVSVNNATAGTTAPNNAHEGDPVASTDAVSMENDDTAISGITGLPDPKKLNRDTGKGKSIPFPVRLGGGESDLQNLVDNFDQIQELARRGKVYVATEEDGDIVTGTILINSPRGFFVVRVKLKKINGEWVIIETLE